MPDHRLLIVQYAGDYREAFRRLTAGGEENYYAQRYSVNAVADLAQQMEEVATLCCQTEHPYNELLTPNVRAIGAGLQQQTDWTRVQELMTQYAPSHLVLRCPIRPLLQWAITHQVPTLALFADSFATQGWRNRLRNYRLVKLLNHPQIEWIGNHGLTASELLQTIGINPEKIIPWDWPAVVTPEEFLSKTIPQQASRPWQVLYVGSVIADKGVGTCIDAIAHLDTQNFPITLSIAGTGNIQQFRNYTQQLGLSTNVNFLGLLSHNQVLHHMQASDLILIPSHHCYPEGLPMTIYEALSTHTPIIASDHPMFRKYLKHQDNAMIVPAEDAASLANAIQTTLSDPDLYQTLSLSTTETWHKIQVPVKFATLLNHWLSSTQANTEWLIKHRLASNIYA